MKNLLVEKICSSSSVMDHCRTNSEALINALLIVVAIVYLVGVIGIFFDGRSDLRSSNTLENRKSGLIQMCVSPVWPIILLWSFAEGVFIGIVGIFKDVKNLREEIRDEVEAEKIKVLEKAMVELETMKREEHDIWMDKFNSIGVRNA